MLKTTESTLIKLPFVNSKMNEEKLKFNCKLNQLEKL